MTLTVVHQGSARMKIRHEWFRDAIRELREEHTCDVLFDHKEALAKENSAEDGSS